MPGQLGSSHASPRQESPTSEVRQTHLPLVKLPLKLHSRSHDSPTAWNMDSKQRLRRKNHRNLAHQRSQPRTRRRTCQTSRCVQRRREFHSHDLLKQKRICEQQPTSSFIHGVHSTYHTSQRYSSRMWAVLLQTHCRILDDDSSECITHQHR